MTEAELKILGIAMERLFTAIQIIESNSIGTETQGRIEWIETSKSRHAAALACLISIVAPSRKLRVIICEDCAKNPADSPSKLCPGCAAYREHTGAI